MGVSFGLWLLFGKKNKNILGFYSCMARLFPRSMLFTVNMLTRLQEALHTQRFSR